MQEIEFKRKRSLYDRFWAFIYGTTLALAPLFFIAVPLAMYVQGEAFTPVWILFFLIGLVGLKWSIYQFKYAFVGTETVSTSDPEMIATAAKKGWVPCDPQIDLVELQERANEAHIKQLIINSEQASASNRMLFTALSLVGYALSLSIFLYQVYTYLRSGAWPSLPIETLVDYLPYSVQQSYHNPEDWVGFNNLIVEVLQLPLVFGIVIVSSILYLLREKE